MKIETISIGYAHHVIRVMAEGDEVITKEYLDKFGTFGNHINFNTGKIAEVHCYDD